MRGAEMSSACVQGSHPIAFQQSHNYNPQSPVTAWQYQPSNVVPKIEPMEDTEQSSNNYYMAPKSSSSPIERRPNNNSNFIYNVPLTPPDSETVLSPKNQTSSPPPHTEIPPTTYHVPYPTTSIVSSTSSSQYQNLSSQTVMTTSSPSSLTPPANNSSTVYSNESSNEALQSLQRLESNAFQARSPRKNSTSDDNEPKRLDDDIRIPKVNSNGKVKVYKCKQCEFTAETKADYWDHKHKFHIRADKLLACHKCPFVTEFKHHLEYHFNSFHTGKKPFKCDKCDYRCVNKSMLSSHAKCHSDVHQYRCSDCSYASKYCHSLKLHLRKYNHKPAKVLNPDGSINPFTDIDVYGTRRGPKMKPLQGQQQGQVQNQQDQKPIPGLDLINTMLPYNLSPHVMFSHSPLSFPFPLLNGFPTPNSLLLQNFQQLVSEQQKKSPPMSPEHIQEESSRSSPEPMESGVLDLSKQSENDNHRRPKSKRKGVAFKLNSLQANASEEESDEDMTTMFSNVVAVHDTEADQAKEVVQGKESRIESRNGNESPRSDTNNNSKSVDSTCPFCGINFGDMVLYTIHMGYHSNQNPFSCNMCGTQCGDKVSFFLHIARSPHT